MSYTTVDTIRRLCWEGNVSGVFLYCMSVPFFLLLFRSTRLSRPFRINLFPSLFLSLFVTSPTRTRVVVWTRGGGGGSLIVCLSLVELGYRKKNNIRKCPAFQFWNSETHNERTVVVVAVVTTCPCAIESFWLKFPTGSLLLGRVWPDSASLLHTNPTRTISLYYWITIWMEYQNSNDNE